MEKINPKEVSRDIMRELSDFGDVPSVAYKHEGAEVFIASAKNPEGSRFGYTAKACVVIMKGDEIIKVEMNEHVGDEFGTIFGRVSVKGMPERESPNGSAELGLYPHYVISKSTTSESSKNDDILTHAVSHLLSYDRDLGIKGIGAVLKKFVPGSVDEIRMQLKNTESTEKDAEEETQKRAQVTAMNKKFSDFI